MAKKVSKQAARKRRHNSMRLKIKGTPDCPRLNVYRSTKHVYAQLIDDTKGETLAAASTMDNELNSKNGGNVEAAKEVGALVAKRAKEKGYETVVFDRGGFVYHGRVSALADAAREEGLKF
ncbi:large subunit ribosomal protein L18 [Geomicrobium halophilum]|uniref:Large ribosomal subunit protein uL18 n=1 Tax=Geomicrobium halophilum TaxID=549000 RepID=A0A841PRE0_9BACL|nr:50S ribosomal protein L18 [Geomicrobium halophilum]MBB6451477.1 large subunit ribosomal protein L18 [Geomicrobium halophilum]